MMWWKWHMVFLLASLLAFQPILGQKQQENLDSLAYKKKKIDPVEVDFLFSYYSQDGSHSAVTGGQGTEELTNTAPVILLNIPLDTNKYLSIDFGVDIYTSASTDRIDYVMSSASYKDMRTHISAEYEQEISKIGLTVGGGGHFSIESDYLSRGLSFSLLKSMNHDNIQVGLRGNFYFDVVGWGWLNPDYYKNVAIVYPVELRDTNWFDDGRRNTYQLAFSYMQDLTQRIKIGVFTDLVFQKGLLSTPFHRVYFYDYEGAKVEMLPETRIKLPIGLRLNYYATHFMILRAYYRYYSDTWEISAHTASLEVPFKITNFFSVYPWYRYLTQTGTDYFAPYAEHSVNNKYYTSDYDLSAFNSHEAGIGLRYSPPMGLLRWRTPLIKDKRMLKSIEVRYGRYWRSDGMVSDIISLGVGFTGF